MASPAAVLSIMVKAQGVQAASAQLGSLDKSARTAGTGIAAAEGHAKRSSKTFSAMGTAAKSAGVLIGAAGLAKGISSAVSEYREAQKTGAQTTAVLKSTGSAAKVTSKHIQDLAGSISKKSGIDDEAIQQSENMLLTFTKLRNETGKGNKIFDQATQVVTDMSVALGQSGKSSAIQLGKALNDPVKGVTALGRVGVKFDDQQKKQIATMVKAGDTLGAQKVILKELKTEFAGSAAAQATMGDKFKVSLGNIAEAAGAVLVPALDKVLGFFTKLMDGMVRGTGVGGALVSKFREIGGALAPLAQSIQQIVGWLRQHTEVTRVLAIGLGVLAGAIVAVNLVMAANPFVLAAVAIAALVVGVVTAYREFSTFRNIVDTVVNAVKTVLPTMVAIAKGVMTAFLAVFRAVWPVIKGYFVGGFIAVKGIITGYAQILSGAVQVIKGVLHGDFREIWDGIKKIFTGGFTAIKGVITGAAHALGAAASAVGGAIKGAFEGALRGAAGTVVGFVNGIIDVINKIPGVNISHVGVPQSLQAASKAVGGTAQGQTHGLARGGAFGLTGGTVNAPMVMMGEEAPRYPEFVIPTNPAYRKRAQMLLGQAAGSVGLKTGGVVGAIKSVGGAIAGGAGALLGKLPGVGDLPTWLKGAGKYVLTKAGSYIKDKVTDILPGGGGGGGGPIKVPANAKEAVSQMIAYGREMSSRNLPYVYGGGHGSWGPPFDCSGFVSAILHAGGLNNTPMSTDGLKVFGQEGDGQAVTIGVRGSSGRSAHTMIRVGNTFFESGGGGNGAHMRAGWNRNFPIHRHPGGFAEGGVLGDLAKLPINPAAFDPSNQQFVGWGLRKGGVIKAFAKGGVNGAPGVDSEQGWLNSAWAKVAPLFGKDAASMPLPSLFKHIRFSGATPFVGVATDPGKGNESAELLWPRWLWQSSKGQKKLDERTKLQLFIHEMAHRFQSADQTKAEWMSEGGAEAFARIMMGRNFGGAIRNGADPYNAYVTKVMKEKGIGWVTGGQFANATAGAGMPGHGQPRSSGVSTAIAAARRAGFKGESLVNMIAIAGRESGYDPTASNLVPPDHSIGLWQINQLAHHGKFGSDQELMNPNTNAKAAWKLSGGGKNLSPWNHKGGPLGGTNVPAARAAVLASRGAGGGTAGGGGGGGSNAASGAASAAAKVNPFDQKMATADLSIQQAQTGKASTRTFQQVSAMVAKRKLIGKRIQSIRKALKGNLSGTKRLALTQELTQRLQEHAQLGTDIKGLVHPEVAGGGAGVGDIGGGVGVGDTGGDPNQALIDSNAALQAKIDEQIAADKEHAEAIRQNAAELKRQTDFASSATASSSFQAWKALADVMSGQMGARTRERGRTPGSGVEYSYSPSTI